MSLTKHNSVSSTRREFGIWSVVRVGAVLLLTAAATFLTYRVTTRMSVLDLAKYAHTKNLPTEMDLQAIDAPSGSELLINEIGVAFTVPGDWKKNTRTGLIDYWVYEAKDESLRAMLWYPDGGPKELHPDVVSETYAMPKSTFDVILMPRHEFVEYEKWLRRKASSSWTGEMYSIQNKRQRMILRESPADSRVEVSILAASGRTANVLLDRTDGGKAPVDEALQLAKSFRFFKP